MATTFNILCEDVPVAFKMAVQYIATVTFLTVTQESSDNPAS